MKPSRFPFALAPVRVVVLLALLGPPPGTAQTQTTPPSQRQARPAPRQQQMSEAEIRMRIMLLQKSMGFGGIFGPMIAPLNRPSAPKQKSCDAYSDYAACQAYRNGDQWAADRLQRQESTPAERDWYNR